MSVDGGATGADRLTELTTAERISHRFVSGDLQADIAALAGRAEQRRRHGLDVTVVGIAGSTGSGKSSLFNALTGLELAETGVRRPTTLTSSACVFGQGDGSAVLDWLGVARSRRVTHRSLLDERDDVAAGLVLLDLPDHDSVVDEHREEVDRLLPRLDLMVWVTDPVKYADAALHLGYLRRLSRHDAVVTVVLNQIDRLGAHDLDLCLTDLHRLLQRDGLTGCTLLATSAATHRGVDELGRHLVAAAAARRAVDERLDADVALLADRLSGELAMDVEHPGAARVDPDLVEDDVVTALDLDARERDVSARRLAQARRALAWPVQGRADVDHDAGVGPHQTSSDVLDSVVTGHLRKVRATLPEPWRAELDAVVRTDDLCERWSRQADAIDSLAGQQTPEEWAGHRRAEWAVLAVSVASALVLIVLLAVLLVTGSVPLALWVLPAVGAIVAGGGVVLLSRRARRYRHDWAVASVSSTRTATEDSLRSSVRSELVEPLRRAEREVADTSSALARSRR